MVEPAKKPADSPATTTPASSPTTAAAAGQLELPTSASTGATPEPAPERIDVSKFLDPGADFIDLQIHNSKQLAQITFGLLKLKTEQGEPNAIAAASRNWHEASKVAADVIEKYIALQREAGTLLSLDDVEDVIATELEEIRKGLRRLGKRASLAANPENPALAEKAIDAAVDQLLVTFNNLVDRAKLELAAAAAPDPLAAAS